MGVLLGLLRPLQILNAGLLSLGRALALSALAVMVIFILYQVVMRYFFNAAPNWTEEAARFLMLWMTGLIGPLAYRQGGFVAIDMAERALPLVLARLLTLLLLLIAMVVIWTCVQLGWENVNSLSGRGRSASLRLPLPDGETFRFRNYHAYYSLFIGFCLLALVNTELLLRQVIKILGGADRLEPLDTAGPID
ncbi:MAG: TRAP transporter small permease subunit [Pseudomonadota bacterium]